MCRIRIWYLFVYHTPLTYQTSDRPLRTVCPVNFPVLLECPDEFIPNTKVVRNRSNTPDTQPTRVSDVHDTSGLILPPLRTPCPVITQSRYFIPGWTPAPFIVYHTTLEHRFQFIVMPFNCLLCLLVFTVSSPPLISGRPRCYRWLYRCRPRLRHRRQYHYRRAYRQAVPLHVSLISPIYLYYFLH